MLKAVASIVKIIFYYIYDTLKFIRFGSKLYPNSLELLERDILILTHVIEKGLSYNNPHTGFGKIKIKMLVNNIKKYIGMGYDTNRFVIENAISALQEYLIFNESKGQSDSEIANFINENLQKYLNIHNSHCAGIVVKQKEEINITNSFEEIFSCRSSIREFDETDLNDSDIYSVINMVTKTPSACNRQPCKIYDVKSKNIIQEIQNYHGGMKGFKNIKRIFVITVNLSKYLDAGDRNLMYIDGGLLAMSLLLSLQNKGIATCAIQWQQLLKNNKFIGRLLKLPDEERTVILIAAGNYPRTFKVSKSAKKSVSEFYKILQ
jgi:nitroreductase